MARALIGTSLLSLLLGVAGASAGPKRRALLGDGLRPLPSAEELGLQGLSLHRASESSTWTGAGPRSWRGTGSARALRGRVCARHIFVSDPGASWSESSRERAIEASREAMAHLEDRARARGIDLSWQVDVRDFVSAEEIPTESRMHTWTKAVVRSASQLGLFLPLPICPIVECQQRLAIIHVPRVGRSYALPDHFNLDAEEERVVMFARRLAVAESEASILVPERPTAFAHEILHVFGAKDLYQPESRRRAAERRYPEDIMLYSHGSLAESHIEAYTAYSIGWSDEEPPGLAP